MKNLAPGVAALLLLAAGVALADPSDVRFEGRVLWDEPARTMPRELADALTSTRRLLTRPPPSLSSPSTLRDRLSAWLGQRVGPARALLAAPPTGDRTELVRVVLAASLLEHVIDSLMNLAPPPSIARDPDAAPLFREQFAMSLEGVRATTREAWARCQRLEVAHLPPALQPWPDACATRAGALALATPAPAPPRPSPRRPATPEMPPACRGAGPIRDPDAPAPDETAPRRVAVALQDEDVRGADRARVIQAIAARLRRVHRGLSLVSTEDVLRAERLVAERRLDEAAPVCGQAPPLGAVLAKRFPNLVLARASALPLGDTCQLSVWLDRAGTADASDLPPGISIDLPGGCEGAASWTRAIARMRVHGSTISALLGRLNLAEARADAAAYEDDDPWLRIGSTLRDAEAQWTSCLPAPGAASFALSWTLTPTGGVQTPRARVMGGSTPAIESARTCVERTLGRLVFPCTPSGHDEPIEATVCVARVAR